MRYIIRRLECPPFKFCIVISRNIRQPNIYYSKVHKDFGFFGFKPKSDVAKDEFVIPTMRQAIQILKNKFSNIILKIKDTDYRVYEAS